MAIADVNQSRTQVLCVRIRFVLINGQSVKSVDSDVERLAVLSTNEYFEILIFCLFDLSNTSIIAGNLYKLVTCVAVGLSPSTRGVQPKVLRTWPVVYKLTDLIMTIALWHSVISAAC